ncbi:MAG: HupE/UreJ family protein [Desulfobacteraceae bacterium]|nr:HupE/UreJ family protein [Desulfobacteraceae bacterium]
MNFRILKIVSFLLMLISGSAYGHEGRPIYIEIKESANNILTLRWKIPPVLKEGRIPEISLESKNCRFLSGLLKPSLIGIRTYRWKNSYNDAKIVLKYPAENPALSTLVYLQRISGESHSIFNGPELIRLGLPKKLSGWDVAKQYIIAGVKHILAGYDHLLFLICLMMITGGLGRTMTTITGFTLGHSITLAMATLDFWQIRTELVEALIALSIVMLAVEIIKGKPKSLIRRYPAIVATAFGLLHGFGFASALSELGLPQNFEIPALAYFNIGVEIGQAFFVIALFFLLKIVRFNKGLLKNNNFAELIPKPLITVYAAGLMGSYWLMERTFGIIIE